MDQKKMPKCGFGCRKTFEGQKDFDVDYVDIEIKKVARKIGPGDEDYIIEDKIIEHRRPIADVINSQAGEAGIEAYLKPYLLTGEDLPDVKVSDDVQDFSAMPESLAEAMALGERSKALFAKLPDNLKNGAKTADEFLSNLTQEKFDAFIASCLPKTEEKEDKKVEEK